MCRSHEDHKKGAQQTKKGPVLHPLRADRDKEVESTRASNISRDGTDRPMYADIVKKLYKLLV